MKLQYGAVVALAVLSSAGCDDASSGTGGAGGAGSTATGTGTQATSSTSSGSGPTSTSSGTMGDSTVLVGMINDPFDLVTDGTNAYFSESDGDNIFVVSLAGNSFKALVPGAAGARGLALDGQKICWQGSDYTVNAANLDGSGVAQLYQHPTEIDTHVAAHGGSVYFLSTKIGDTAVYKVSEAGGAATVVTPINGVFPKQILTANDTGMFISADNPSTLTKDILFEPFAGGAPTTIASIKISDATLLRVAADSTSAYYFLRLVSSATSPLQKAPITGSGATQVYEAPDSADDATPVMGGILFANEATMKAGIDEVDAGGAVTPFYTPPDQTSVNNGHRLLRVTPDGSTLVWVTGTSSPGSNAVHRKAI